jgi:hypothetical protein
MLIARRAWTHVFQTLKQNNFQPKALYSTNLSIKIKGEIKIFSGENKLKQFMPLSKLCRRHLRK